MTLAEARHLTTALRGEFEHLSTSIPAAGAKWARPDPRQLQPRLLPAILAGRWNVVETEAVRQIKACSATLSAMASSQARSADACERSQELSTLLGADWIPPARRPDWEQVRVLLAGELARQGVDADAIERRVALVAGLSEASVAQAATRALESSTRHLDGIAYRNTACLMGATLAASVARFNQQMASTAGVPAHLAQTLTEWDATARQHEKQVWRALKSGDLGQAAAAADQSSGWASALVLDVLPAHAAAIARERQAHPRRVDDGLLAVHVGDTLRRLLLATALGRTVHWLAGWGASNPQVRQWMQAAASRGFAPVHAPPPGVQIATLLAHPLRFDGKPVTVHGALGPVAVAHHGEKVVSSAPVADATGQSISAVLPYIKLDSGGLVGGCYARLSGVWQARSPEAAGGPALKIDRRSLGDEGKDSWIAWVEAALRPVMQAVPHALDVGWSWEAGPDGAANALRYGMWFVAKEVQ